MVRLRRCLLAALLTASPAAISAQPTACGPGGAFPDVPENHPFCDWIHQLDLDQIAEPCDGTNFCPDAPVTRAQLALFVYRLTRGTPTSQVDADTLDGLDSSSFGDMTAVNTIVGSGLAGGAESGAVSLSIPTGGVNSDRIENATIKFEDLEDNNCADNTVIQWSGASWVCGSVATAPLVFVHQVTVANSFGAYSIIDNGAINNNGNVKLFVTLDNSNGVGGAQVVAVRRITSDQWPLAVDRWVLENMNGLQVDPLPVNSRYNILVLP